MERTVGEGRQRIDFPPQCYLSFCKEKLLIKSYINIIYLYPHKLGGVPGTSAPKQIVKMKQIQVRNPDGSIRIINQQQIVSVAPKPQETKVQVFRSADGKLSVKGLAPGQQLIQMPDGKIHIVNTQGE